jgi:hypothetical protein
MTLYIYQPGIQPLGQFDCDDSYASTLKGGEVGTLTSKARVNSASEKAAYDVADGYVGLARRAAVRTAFSASNNPLWLLDEGTTGYGTLFGSVIGTPAGLAAGSALGPHTTAGSGKVTCWDKPGLYAVSTDAVADDDDNLVVTNVSLVPGTAVEYTATGLLCADGGTGALNKVVGYLVEFETSPFLVTTPPSLVGATMAVTRVVISFNAGF